MIEIIVRNINELCKAKGMTLKELSDKCGVSARYFVNRTRDFTVTFLFKVAGILEVAPEKLWDEDFTKEIKLDAINRQIKELTEEREKLL